MIKISAFAALALLLLASCRSQPPVVDQTPCGIGARHAESCSFEAMTLVKAVDDRRILVALDIADDEHPADGDVDRLFLYTAEEPVALPQPAAPFAAHVAFSNGRLVVVPEGGAQPIEFLVDTVAETSFRPEADVLRYNRALGLSHYTGYTGLALGALQEIERARECGAQDCARYQVDEVAIVFPA